MVSLPLSNIDVYYTSYERRKSDAPMFIANQWQTAAFSLRPHSTQPTDQKYERSHIPLCN